MPSLLNFTKLLKRTNASFSNYSRILTGEGTFQTHFTRPTLPYAKTTQGHDKKKKKKRKFQAIIPDEYE
jgi:hypothetical protein